MRVLFCLSFNTVCSSPLACSFCALHTYSSRSTRNKPLPLSSVNVQSTMHKHFAIKSVITTSGESINFGAQERSKWRGPFVLAWSPSLNSVHSVYITHDKKCREAIIFKYSNTTCRHTKHFCLWGKIVFEHPWSGVVVYIILVVSVCLSVRR